MTTVTADEFARRATEILARVARDGEAVAITQNDREIARLTPAVRGKTVRDALQGVYGKLSDEEGEELLRLCRIPERGLDEELGGPWE